MKRLFLLFALLAFFAPSGADAQGFCANQGFCVPKVAAAGYVGPGDVKGSAIWWGGLRAYSSATRGTAAINLCDTAGNNCADVSTDAATGALNAPGTRGSDNCNSVNCLIAIIYDKTGGGHNCTSSGIFRPFLVWNGLGGTLPVVRSVRANNTLCTITLVGNTAQPFTVSVVAMRSSAFTNENWLGGDVTSSVALWGYRNSANTLQMQAPTTATATASDSSFHALQYVFSGSSSDLNVDGNVNTVSPGTNALSATFTLLSALGQGDSLGGDWTETGIWASAFSSGDSTSMCHNQRLYWGFSGSC